MKHSTAFPAAIAACLLMMTPLSPPHPTAQATSSQTYRARLSPMPVTSLTVDKITGEGEVILTLNGNRLSINGHFSGMSSAAIMAHIHNGPPAQPGPVMFQLQFNNADDGGSISGELQLTPAQLTALNENALYVQIHSANNPAGELRGWIFLLSHFQNL